MVETLPEVACEAPASYCGLLEEVFADLGYHIIVYEEGSTLPVDVMVYAGGSTGLRELAKRVKRHRIKLVVIPENVALDKDITEELRSLGNNVRVFIIAHSLRDHKILQDKLRDSRIAYIPIHLYTPKVDSIRDPIPVSGGIAAGSNDCKWLEEVAEQLSDVGFNPLIINFSTRACSSPWIISVVTDRVFSLTPRITIGIVRGGELAGYPVFNALYRNTRPIIACGDIEVPVESKTIIKTLDCSVDSLVKTLVFMQGRIEYYRRAGVSRPRYTSLDSEDLSELKVFLAEHLG